MTHICIYTSCTQLFKAALEFTLGQNLTHSVSRPFKTLQQKMSIDQHKINAPGAQMQ